MAKHNRRARDEYGHFIPTGEVAPRARGGKKERKFTGTKLAKRVAALEHFARNQMAVNRVFANNDIRMFNAIRSQGNALAHGLKAIAGLGGPSIPYTPPGHQKTVVRSTKKRRARMY